MGGPEQHLHVSCAVAINEDNTRYLGIYKIFKWGTVLQDPPASFSAPCISSAVGSEGVQRELQAESTGKGGRILITAVFTLVFLFLSSSVYLIFFEALGKEPVPHER